jgi:hypothetical protein
MQSMGVCSLNHDTTTSYRLGHTLFFLKFTPTCTMYERHKGVPIFPSTASQGVQTLCTHPTSNMDMGCSQWGFAASTMTPQHHTGSTIPQFS